MGDCAVLGGRTQFELELFSGRGFCRRFRPILVWRFSIYHLVSFLRSCGPILVYSSWCLRWSWRDNVFLGGRFLGVSFGGGPVCIWFLSFVQGGEFRWLADFQLILARESAPSFSSFPQQQFTTVPSSSWDAVSCSSHFLFF